MLGIILDLPLNVPSSQSYILDQGFRFSQTGDRPQFVTIAEHYWRATRADFVEAKLRLGNRGLSPVTVMETVVYPLLS